MIYTVVSLFDKAAACFNAPQFVPHAGVAIRQFEDLVNGADSVFSRHPEHFELYQLGHFDDSNADFAVEKTGHMLLTNGAALVSAKPV